MRRVAAVIGLSFVGMGSVACIPDVVPTEASSTQSATSATGAGGSATSSSATTGAGGQGGSAQATSGPGGAGGSGGAGGQGGAGGSGGASGQGGAGGAGGGQGGSGGGLVCVPDAVSSCYTGAAATQNVGLCQDGASTCAPDGLSEGPCVGEVLPAADACWNHLDEDCDAADNTCHVWSKTFGNMQDQVALGIAVGASDNIVLTGKMAGSFSFGGGMIVGGASDIFIAKLAQNGAHIWSKVFLSSGLHEARAVSVNETDGSLVVTGRIAGSVDFGGGARVTTGSGDDDLVVAKFSAIGTPMWSADFGDSANQVGNALATDAAGSVVVVGAMAGAATVGAFPLTSAGGADALMTKMDAAGGVLWALRAGGTGDDQLTAVAIGNAGASTVVGGYQGTVDLGGGPLPVDPTGTNVLVAKYSGNGAFMWGKGFGDGANQIAASIAIDSAGDSLTLGTFAGSIDFGGGALTSAGGKDVFLVKLSGVTGAHLWSLRFGDASDQTAAALRLDAADNIFLTGNFEGSIDFGGGALTNPTGGTTDVFIAKLDAAGGHLWSHAAGDALDDTATALGLGSAGDPVLTGQYEGTIDFDNTQLTAVGAGDIFVTRLLAQ